MLDESASCPRKKKKTFETLRVHPNHGHASGGITRPRYRRKKLNQLTRYKGRERSASGIQQTSESSSNSYWVASLPYKPPPEGQFTYPHFSNSPLSSRKLPSPSRSYIYILYTYHQKKCSASPTSSLLSSSLLSSSTSMLLRPQFPMSTLMNLSCSIRPSQPQRSRLLGPRDLCRRLGGVSTNFDRCTNPLYLILSTLTLSILETSGMPHQRMSNTGVLLLGYMENDSENLDIGMEAAHLESLNAHHENADHPLASGFSIRTGSVDVRMPTDIPARNDYFLVRKSWRYCQCVDCSLTFFPLILTSLW